MSQDSLPIRIWKDPVWSKVIAVTIVGLAGFLAYVFIPNLESSAKHFLLNESPIPNWLSLIFFIVLILSVAYCLIVSLRQKEQIKTSLSSMQWFSEIEHQIAECKSARIYLRSFAHPDQFRAEHRDALLGFMQILKSKLEAGANIKIVAYHFQKNEKSGFDWLKSELGEDSSALPKVTIIPEQPVANSSSMYLFDSGVMLYNRRDNNSYSYYLENLQGTVVHHLLGRGYETAWSAL